MPVDRQNRFMTCSQEDIFEIDIQYDVLNTWIRSHGKICQFYFSICFKTSFRNRLLAISIQRRITRTDF